LIDEARRRRDLSSLIATAGTIGTGVLVTIAGVEIDSPLLYAGGSGMFLLGVGLTAIRWRAYRQRYRR